MDATEQGLAVIRSFEGRALKAYRDSVGVWTIGFGITNYDKWAVQYLGRAIGAGMTITEDQAEYLLRESLSRSYAPAVAKAMPGASPAANDAGLSFHYNTGAIGRASWVKKWLDKLDFHSAIVSWNKGGGKVLAGLTRRREREYAMITRGDYGPEGRTAPPVLDSTGNIVHVADKDHHLAATPGMLRIGDQGPEVTELNATLATLGFKTTESHDVFDAVTQASVISFQKAHAQLDDDGVVGPATRAAINREIEAKAKVSGSLKIAGTAVGATGGAHLSGLVHVPAGVYVTLAIIAFVVIGTFVWKYRDELAAVQNR